MTQNKNEKKRNIQRKGIVVNLLRSAFFLANELGAQEKKAEKPYILFFFLSKKHITKKIYYFIGKCFIGENVSK